MTKFADCLKTHAGKTKRAGIEAKIDGYDMGDIRGIELAIEELTAERARVVELIYQAKPGLLAAADKMGGLQTNKETVADKGSADIEAGKTGLRDNKNDGMTGKIEPSISKMETVGSREGFIFSPKDIPYQTAYNAHSGSSFSSEKRATQEQEGYVGHMEGVIDHLSRYAKTDEQKSYLKEWFNNYYKPGYLKRQLALLGANSRTMSSMITGPANLPTRSNQKKLEVSDKRMKELIAFDKQAQDRMRSKLRGTQAISSTDPEATEKLQKKLDQLEKNQKAMTDANKIVRGKLSDADKISKLSGIGLTGKGAEELLIPDYSGRLGFPAYALTNNNANIKRVKERIAELEKRADKAEEVGGTETKEFNGGSVEINYEDGFLRILHDSKPGAEVRQELKSNGFRWSPTDTAWRRKITPDAKRKAEQITGVSFENDSTNKPLLSQQSPTSTGNTIAKVEEELRGFLGRGYDNLIKRGKLEIVRTVAGLPENVRKNMLKSVFHRYYNSISPMSDWGHAMFAENRDAVVNYGKNHFTLDIDKESNGVIYAGDSKFTDALKKFYIGGRGNDVFVEMSEIYGEEDALERLISEANPDNIVDSAGLWDGDIIGDIYEDILEPNGWKTIETRDGAVTFDESIVKIEKPDEYDLENQALYSKDGQIVGAYDPKTGKTYLVADAIKPGQAQDVFLHEAAHAILREDKRFIESRSKILSDFARLARMNQAVKAAKKKVPEDTGLRAGETYKTLTTERKKEVDAIREEEALAYFLQDPTNRQHSIFKRIIAAVKAALFRMGLVNMRLNEADLVALFTQGAKAWSKRGAVAEESFTTDDPAYSTTDEQEEANSHWSGDGVTDGKNLGLKVHNGQSELARKLEAAIQQGRVTPWHMPDSMVAHDRKGRVNTGGRPKGDVELAERISGIFGKKIVWATIGDKYHINGVVVRNKELSGNIFIDIRSLVPAHMVLGHELSHFMETEHPETFKDLMTAIDPLIQNMEIYKKKTAAIGLSDFEVKTEIVGDLLGDNFNNEQFWQDVAANSVGKFGRITAIIRQWLQVIIDKLTGSRDFGSELFVSDLVAARKILAKATAQAMRDKGKVKKDHVEDSLDMVGDIRYSISDESPMSLASLEETAKTMAKGSITYLKNSKVDSTFLERLFSTPEYYFKKFAASARVLQAALLRRDVRHTKQQEILGGFVEFVQKLRKSNMAAYTEANDHLVDTDQSGIGFRIKEQDDGSWKVFDPKKKTITSFTFADEQSAVKAMIAAEGQWLSEQGYSDEAIEAVKMARQLTNRAFDVMAADMRKIIQEAEDNGRPNPFIGDGALDEAGRYGVYADGKKKPVALFATQKEADDFMDKAAQAISYMAVGKSKKAQKELGKIDDEVLREFTSEQKAKRWAAKHGGTVKGQKRFGKMTVKMRTDAEMRPLTVKEALAQMGDLRGTYFPRIRESGEYVLIARKDGENPIRKSFDLPGVGDGNLMQSVLNSVLPIGREAKKLKLRGYTVTVSKDTKPTDDVFENIKLMTSIDALHQDSMSGVNKNDSDEIRAAQHVDMIITMQIADIFKARGYLASRMKRMAGDEVWEGYETDMGKALTQYGKNIASGTAKRDTARAMLNAFTGRDYSWADYKQDKTDAGEKITFAEYQDIIEERRIDPGRQKNLFKDVRGFIVDVLRNDEQVDRIMGTMKGLAVHKFLGLRVSSAAINMTNMFTGVVGTMSGHTGESLTRSMGRVAEAATAYGKYRSGVGTVSKQDSDLFQEITSRGWDEAQFDEAASSELRSKMGDAWNKYATVSMFMFSAVEKANRAMTIFAAYKAVEKQNPTMEAEQIWEQAKEISDRAHGTYGKETLPAMARGGDMNRLLRLPLTFTKFTHNYMLNILDLGFTKKEYKAAAYLLLSPAIMAGAGSTLVAPLLFGLAGALGLGGDDPEEEFYKWAEEAFGGGAFTRHGLAGVAGINIKGSMAVSVPMPSDIAKLTMADMFGPVGGVVGDIGKGVKSIASGDIAKGVESLLPTALGSMSKSVREATEGITTSNYGSVFYGDEPLKANTMDAMLRFISFNPSRISGIREMQWNEKEVAAKYQERKSAIYKDIKRGHLQGEAITPEILKEIKRYNELVAGSGRRDIKPITAKSIRLMLKMSSRASKFERSRIIADDDE